MKTDNKIIARRYAKGLMLFLPKEDWGRAEEDLRTFIEIVSDSQSELGHCLLNPAFSMEEKKAIILAIQKKSKMSIIIYNFLIMLLDRKRIGLLSLIFDEAIDYMDKALNRLRVKVESFLPLDEKELVLLRDFLKSSLKTDIILLYTIDKDLLGGICLKVKDKVFDASIKAKLYSIKQKLLKQIGF